METKPEPSQQVESDLIRQIKTDMDYSEDTNTCANCRQYTGQACELLPIYRIPVKPHGWCASFQRPVRKHVDDVDDDAVDVD